MKTVRAVMLRWHKLVQKMKCNKRNPEKVLTVCSCQHIWEDQTYISSWIQEANEMELRGGEHFNVCLIENNDCLVRYLHYV